MSLALLFPALILWFCTGLLVGYWIGRNSDPPSAA